MLSTRLTSLSGIVLSSWLAACASDDAGVDPPAKTGLAATVCEPQPGQKPVAPSADGTRVAFLSCATATPTVVVHDLTTDVEVSLGEAPDDSSVEWLPAEHAGDADTFVLFGSASGLWVRAADASSEAVRVGNGPEAVHRAILQRVSNTEFSPRLHVLETNGETLTISIRGHDDGYVEPTTIYTGDGVHADLSLMSASGRTLILTPTSADGNYVRVLWNTTQSEWQAAALTFGPAQWVMAPVGLGDTHNFAFHEDQLVRVELKTGAVQVIAAAGEGLLDNAANLLDREDAPGVKYVYYILNGDPTRRDREGLMSPEPLADANAVAQRLTPDLSTLLYLSDGVLYGVPAEGGDPVALVSEANESARIDATFPGTGSSFAYIVAGAIHRVELADGTSTVIEGATAEEGTVSYDGAGRAILLLDSSARLLRVPEGALEAKPVAESVSGYWPVPNSRKILAISEGTLRAFSFDAP